tara:strand:+ start:188 stop:508 length:321 start_codon:yes stop_codon:yes gene_type:complete
MAFSVITVSDNSETAIVAIGEASYNTYDSIIIANSHASVDVTLDLYLKDASANKKYFLRNTSIPNGTSLKLEKDETHFDNITYGLYVISDNAGGGLDVFVRRNISN